MNIKFENITKYYNGICILNHINLELTENKITCIMGKSGVGKSTLIHILLGIVKPDMGKVEGTLGKKVTAVFQEDRLCENIDAVNNVLLVCDKNIKKDMIEQEFKNVSLCDYENKPVINLSGGMRRRVAIVRAVMPQSDIIVMDEPFKGLNKELKTQVINYIKEKTVNKTVIIVTHDREEVYELSAELIHLE